MTTRATANGLRRGIRMHMDWEEADGLEAEAHERGYLLGEYVRLLVRIGRRHRGEIEAARGLHFVEPPGAGKGG